MRRTLLSPRGCGRCHRQCPGDSERRGEEGRLTEGSVAAWRDLGTGRGESCSMQGRAGQAHRVKSSLCSSSFRSLPLWSYRGSEAGPSAEEEQKSRAEALALRLCSPPPPSLGLPIWRVGMRRRKRDGPVP